MVAEIQEVIEALANTCIAKGISTLSVGRIVMHGEHGVSEISDISLTIHELALKSAAVSQSAQSTPRPSNSPASSVATEDNLRFGSGSRR